MSELDGLADEREWQPLLQVSSEAWLGTLKADSSVLWLGTFQTAKRQIDSENPVGLLPLLEEPYAVVVAKLDEARTLPNSLLITRVVRVTLIRTALESGSDYWIRLALCWLEDIGPSNETTKQLARIQETSQLSQGTRHAAKRLRKQWERAQNHRRT